MITGETVSASPSLAGSVGRRRRSGFTLVEIMVAMTILGLAMTITMVVFLAAVKRASHTETMLKGTSELRYSADMISQAVRSASQPPTVNTSANALGGVGTQLYITPGTFGYLLVQDTTWLDAAHTVKGTKAGQKNLSVSGYLSPATYTPFSGSSRPTGALAAGDVGTYFRPSTDSTLPSPKVSDLVVVTDTLSVPQTSYGPAQTAIVNSVSNNSGNATITVNNNFSYSIPEGTKISIQSTRTQMFAVVLNSAVNPSQYELRYYPDKSVTTKYSVLATDISPSPQVDPSGSATTVPFVVSASNQNYVTINLQMIPRGTTVGRTLQGVQTTVYSRTNPGTP